MKREPLFAVAVLLAASAGALAAQDVVPKVEYQAGHAGMEKKVKGSLSLSDTDIKFLDETGAPVITIPLASITDVSSSVDRKEASVGSKIAFGFLAKSRKEELITVSFESSETAEGVIFKTDKNVSAGVVAKIQFHMKRAGVGPATAGSSPEPVRHPPAQPAPGSPTAP
ncbi:MAG: hypothetical protein ABJD11_06500 [Gemmatimonadota bacterium]